MLVADHYEPLRLSASHLLTGEIDVRASMTYRGEFPLVIEAMAAGAYPLGGWVSTIPLSDVIERGFEVLRAGGAVKVLRRSFYVTTPPSTRSVPPPAREPEGARRARGRRRLSAVAAQAG